LEGKKERRLETKYLAVVADGSALRSILTGCY